MRTYKPLWQEGIVLSPHHLQQQGQWWGFSQQQFAPLAVAEPWGVLEARLDGEALLNHRLKLTAARMRFADGTPIDTSIADVLPPARDLARDIGPDVQSVVVFAGLALLDANGNNCRLDGDAVSRPRRYFREFVEVPDLFGTTDPYQPPERLYHVLARLAGALMTFSTSTTLSEIPPYDHARQDEVFTRLETLIRELLDAVIPSRVVPIGLIRQGPTTWSGLIQDERLIEGADYYLSVNAALPAVELVERIAQLCKVGAPDDVVHIVNSALPGIALRAVQRVPAAIPVRLENQYFALDPKAPGFARMMAVRACQIYLPAAIPDASLELYAVLTSQADR